MNDADEPYDEPFDEQSVDHELGQPDDLLGSQLRELLLPHQDLGARTAEDVDRTLRSRSTTSAALDLLGLGWWTAASLLSEGPGRADGEREGN